MEDVKEIQLDYYFEHMKEDANKDIFDGCKYVWEPLNKINGYLEERLIKNDVKINNAITGDFVSLTGNYLIGDGTKIGANVSIEGPVIIGKNVTIQSGALIRPGSIIGDGAVIGHACEAKHCIIQNGAKVQSFTFCGDSIIGYKTRIGSGTLLSNRRFDQKNIELKINDKKYDTGTDFFGSIVGDNSRFGANCTSYPGTLIGKYTWILPTVSVRKFVASEKILYPKSEYLEADHPKVELK